MKEKKINLLSNTGLIIILLLQTVWFCNTYVIMRDATMEKCRNLLKTAIEQNAELNSIVSLRTIDSIYTQMLNKSNIPAKFILSRIDSKNNILESIRETEKLSRHETILSPQVIWTDNTQSKGIQMQIINPYEVIFRQMFLLLIATAVMMLFVGYCIAYQIGIIVRQQKIAEMKEAFSYAMIHDMKTPIGSLQLGAHILRKLKPEDKEKREKYLLIMEEESEHLYSLANKVLTLAKLEKDSLLLNKEIIPIRLVIEDLINKFKAKSPKPVLFITHLEVETAYADRDYFKEIIVNLIDNAIKYSKDAIEINITSRQKGEYTQIIVRDNGMGIESRDMERIFEKFERGRSAIKHQRKGGPSGFGLGLSYVRQMTEAHDGNVNIRSQKGEYSEFIINLPALIQKL